MRAAAKSIGFLLILCVCLGLAGCGGEDDCSPYGVNCALIADGTEPPCCEGLSCQESLPSGFLICK